MSAGDKLERGGLQNDSISFQLVFNDSALLRRAIRWRGSGSGRLTHSQSRCKCRRVGVREQQQPWLYDSLICNADLIT